MKTLLAILFLWATTTVMGLFYVIDEEAERKSKLEAKKEEKHLKHFARPAHLVEVLEKTIEENQNFQGVDLTKSQFKEKPVYSGSQIHIGDWTVQRIEKNKFLFSYLYSTEKSIYKSVYLEYRADLIPSDSNMRRFTKGPRRVKVFKYGLCLIRIYHDEAEIYEL
ncbi:MAG: hypothetical protein O3C43_06195 [Verrucomicrobia bacterium]|nr:hypothetical protein [Verrucomicrobiota bacterium]MDA1066076.1 hypothetical protein [Verrucomicrobiota bacterium]